MTTDPHDWPPAAAEPIRAGMPAQRPVQGYSANSDAAKRKRAQEPRDRQCWRGECRTACAYEPHCSEKGLTLPAEPDLAEATGYRDTVTGALCDQPAEPDTGEVEALAGIAAETFYTDDGWSWEDDELDPADRAACIEEMVPVVRAVLASDWLAAHDAQVRREAVEQIAREWQFGGWTILTAPPPAGAIPSLALGQRVTDWLRAEADR